MIDILDTDFGYVDYQGILYLSKNPEIPCLEQKSYLLVLLVLSFEIIELIPKLTILTLRGCIM